jgi:integrase
MAIRKVCIKIRIKNPAGKRPYVSPVWETKGRLKPLWARVGGKAEHHPDGVYVLRYGNKWEFVGQETDRVIARKMALEQELEAAARVPKIPRAIHHSGVTIAEACQRYIIRISRSDLTTTTQKEALAPKTISHFERVFAEFQNSCSKTYLREVTGEDIVAYLAGMRAEIRILKNRPDLTQHDYVRMREVTVFGHYAALRRLFKKNGIDLNAMLDDDQIPRAQDREPEAYTEEELIKILEKADEEDKFVLLFFYASGFRKGEVAHLCWTDIDLNAGVCRVQPKPDWNWDSKKKRRRGVRLPDWMMDMLKERRTNRPGDKLVFPSPTGMPQRKSQFLKMVKRLAGEAGVGGRVDLHKFRSTNATAFDNIGAPVSDIGNRLGHANEATTRAYLAKLQHLTDRHRQQANQALKKLA